MDFSNSLERRETMKKRKINPDIFSNKFSDAWLESLEEEEKEIKKSLPKSKSGEEKKEINLTEKEIFHLKKELVTILKSSRPVYLQLNL